MCGQSAGLKNQRFVGSIPTSGTKCSISLEVKRDLAKVESRVRVSYIAPYADMAQSVEHILGKDEVTSSSLVISSI